MPCRLRARAAVFSVRVLTNESRDCYRRGRHAFRMGPSCPGRLARSTPPTEQTNGFRRRDVAVGLQAIATTAVITLAPAAPCNENWSCGTSHELRPRYRDRPH